jgi:hypothetical protein
MAPECTEWWLRPVMSTTRVGEQSATELNAVYRSPALATRSSVGVGMMPPKVLGAPKPTPSVMMSRTLGAPLGGTTCGGHQALDWATLSPKTPPNFAGVGGSCVPLREADADGEPMGALLDGLACCSVTPLWPEGGSPDGSAL